MSCFFFHNWKRYLAFPIYRPAGKDEVGYYITYSAGGPNNQYKICMSCNKIKHAPESTIFWSNSYPPPVPFNNRVAVYDDNYPGLVFLPGGIGPLPDNTSSDKKQTEAWRERVRETERRKRENRELFTARARVRALEQGAHPFITANEKSLEEARKRYQELCSKYGRK